MMRDLLELRQLNNYLNRKLESIVKQCLNLVETNDNPALFKKNIIPLITSASKSTTTHILLLYKRKNWTSTIILPYVQQYFISNWKKVYDKLIYTYSSYSSGGCVDEKGNAITCPIGFEYLENSNKTTMFFNDGTHCAIEELDSVIMTQNGPYTYRDWQDDMQTYREQKWDIKVAQHKAEYYAGLHSKSYKVIIGTLAVPVVIIGSAELGVYYGTRGAFPSVRSLFSLSTKGAKANIAREFGTEFLSNGGDVTRINGISLLASSFSSNIGAELIGSKYRFTIHEGFESNNLKKTVVNFGVGKINNKIQSKYLSSINTFPFNNGFSKAYLGSISVGTQSGLKKLANEKK
ncbi:hypothetical protein [uncultured Maribacter sp.]|uniref:hypothetical protein n=1 Tax=uncultured Maribacter sp. TaxID=431308 RepID=UPI002616C460|nr:hypothetical protein [uncultured Maribacter sp.]